MPLPDDLVKPILHPPRVLDLLGAQVVDVIKDNTESVQAQLDATKEQNAQFARMNNTVTAENKVLSHAILGLVNHSFGQRAALSRKTPLRGGSLGVAY